jgi:outer membrane lipoprotein-sorting protein
VGESATKKSRAPKIAELGSTYCRWLRILVNHKNIQMLNKGKMRKLNIAVAAALMVQTTGLSHPNSSALSAQTKPQTKQLISAISPTSSPMSVERTTDGTNFIQDMADAASQLKSYTFDYETTVFKGNKTIDQRGTFYFKQPRQLRVEMTGNYKHGAVAVLGKDGKVRGHLGGALSAFTMTLAPDSDMLQGANGYPLVDSDFLGMAQVIKKFLQSGCKTQVSEHPVAVEGQTKKVYVLEIFRPSSTDLYKRSYIDPQSLLPIEWFDYQNGGKLFARTVWKNLKFDDSIADSVFKI